MSTELNLLVIIIWVKKNNMRTKLHYYVFTEITLIAESYQDQVYLDKFCTDTLAYNKKGERGNVYVYYNDQDFIDSKLYEKDDLNTKDMAYTSLNESSKEDSFPCICAITIKVDRE